MSLPHGFQFSQASLQDYIDCPRRFQLRYLQRLAWPAVESEPALENERFMQQGQCFHRLVQQHALGLPAGRLEKMIQQEDLSLWWSNYLAHGTRLSASSRFHQPEIALYAPLGGFRLLAKYDALVFTESAGSQKALILDWKTSRRPPSRRWLVERLQTRIYPYLLVRAGSVLNQGTPFSPNQVEMLYWFAAFPEQPEVFPYSQSQYEKDEAFLLELIEQIQSCAHQGYALAQADSACRFCVYRSLCARGERASAWDEDSDIEEAAGDASSAALDLDFEQIAEIKF